MKLNRYGKLIIAVVLMSTLHISAICQGGTYYVSPSGSAPWSGSGSCMNMVTPCSLGTANTYAIAGDTIMMRGGAYNTQIVPSNSGTSITNRISYIAVNGETPIITDTNPGAYYYKHGILLRSRSYILVDGVTVQSPIERPIMITHGSSYNEIRNCKFYGQGSIQFWDGDPSSGGTPCIHNWLHNNVFANTGSVSSDCNDIGGSQLGVPSYDNQSNNNTLEKNVFYCGGHHNLETFTKYNIIKNNYFHNEGCMIAPATACTYGPDENGKYGNRNIQIYDGLSQDGMYNLIEGNRFGHSGPSPDDDGGDGFTLTAPKNIMRYNTIFNSSNNGVLFKTGAGSLADNNRFYNNTIYKSGRYRNTGPLWQGANFRWYGSYARVGNVIKNNILYSYGTGGRDWVGGSGTIDTDNTIVNNYCTLAAPNRCLIYGDPQFVNPDVSNPSSMTLPNLTLQASSPAINKGCHLTQANGSGANSTTLTVYDALYFQDGSWGSTLAGHQADWIAIGAAKPEQIVQIKSIDYTANRITLASPKTWSNGDKIWLYKIADDKQVLCGDAPDMGAHEYCVLSSDSHPQNPRGLTVVSETPR